MPSFAEVGALLQQGEDLDELRLASMSAMAGRTGRPLVVYESNTESDDHTAIINDRDMLGFMETLRGLQGPDLDLILHSNGGVPDAADTVVCYLREKFRHIRVFVPQQAMSAATMVACGADEIVLARHSFLGPIDLQVFQNGEMVAAQDVLDQYELVREDFRGRLKSFWTGPGIAYFPTLLVSCKNALAYGREMVERYLGEYMFAGQDDAAAKARAIAADLADHRKHKHHGRRLSRKYLRELGLHIVDLESDQALQEDVLTIHHCFQHTFAARPFLSKLIQNHEGRFLASFDTTMLQHLGGDGSESDGGAGEED